MEKCHGSPAFAAFLRNSGLQEVPQYDAARDYDPAELLSLVRLGDLEFPSGTDVRQSATNFLLLSMVVDAVAGMPYEEFVRQR